MSKQKESKIKVTAALRRLKTQLNKTSKIENVMPARAASVLSNFEKYSQAIDIALPPKWMQLSVCLPGAHKGNTTSQVFFRHKEICLCQHDVNAALINFTLNNLETSAIFNMLFCAVDPVPYFQD